MELKLADKVVFVAGSSKGIGKSIAYSFLQEGARVVITGRDKNTLNETLTGFLRDFQKNKILTINEDLTQTEQINIAIRKVHDTWGNVDCLVANIGSGASVMGWDIKEEEWNRVFQINLWGSVKLAERILPKMIESKQGNIIFISSIAGIEAIAAPLPYNAAKSAVINYSKNLSCQVAKHNIRVNCIAPGNILTKDGSWEKKLKTDPKMVEDYINNNVPFGRFGDAKEIANIVLFLASETSSFITGACIVADGGQTRSI